MTRPGVRQTSVTLPGVRGPRKVRRGAVRPIVETPAPVLRAPAEPVASFDGVADLAADLVATMHAARGLGLAAPQIGVPSRLAVVTGETEPLVLVNPEIIARHGRQVGWEACLSVPNLVAEVERPLEMVVEAADVGGHRRRLRVTGLLARAVAHEVDHLDGRLYVDLVPADALVDTREHPTPPDRTGRAAAGRTRAAR